ncbi:FliM/FliN family flagellar motor switch protein [Stakelama marina]|uniref:Flagellar motor switch protein FliN n=1 Tax=Stakelama marina TaxID=2826939 RepID=A0A8T4I9B2_9SPHN|nr:FliM/FliN family flagellar motor switch protein [Stakelama marina]MBR0550951.1 FliM/FliN family flagellar motor switch protein [Stakelama marina]
MSVLNDIQVDCTIMLGSTTLPIREVLKMSRGAMIPLDCKEDDPTLVFVNGRVVAKGQIRVAGDKMSLQVDDVVRREG